MNPKIKYVTLTLIPIIRPEAKTTPSFDTPVDQQGMNYTMIIPHLDCYHNAPSFWLTRTRNVILLDIKFHFLLCSISISFLFFVLILIIYKRLLRNQEALSTFASILLYSDLYSSMENVWEFILKGAKYFS